MNISRWISHRYSVSGTCSAILLVLLVTFGVGAFHHNIHLESEADSPTHNPRTCPQCQALNMLGGEEPIPFVGSPCRLNEAEIKPLSASPLHVENWTTSRPQNRSPPRPAHM